MRMKDMTHDLHPNNSSWDIFPNVSSQLAASSNAVIREFGSAGGSQSYISLQLYIQPEQKS